MIYFHCKHLGCAPPVGSYDVKGAEKKSAGIAAFDKTERFKEPKGTTNTDHRTEGQILYKSLNHNFHNLYQSQNKQLQLHLYP